MQNYSSKQSSTECYQQFEEFGLQWFCASKRTHWQMAKEVLSVIHGCCFNSARSAFPVGFLEAASSMLKARGSSLSGSH